MQKNIQQALSAGLSMLSRITTTKHEFDETLETRGGGPVRYVLEMLDRTFFAWYDDDTSVVVVTPLEKWDIDNWAELVDDCSAVPLLTYREVNGQILKMTAQAFPVPSTP